MIMNAGNIVITGDTTVGEIVTLNLGKADVFKKHHIDFCCGGKKTLNQVCKNKAVTVDELIVELNIYNSGANSNSQNFNEWKLDFLIDYIINTHHQYVKQNLTLITEYINKVAKVHGEEHIELVTINELFMQAANELSAHIIKEENVLFPYIKELVNSPTTNQNAATSFGTIKTPIQMMEDEHELVGNIFKTIKELSNDYKAPVGACTTYKLAYHKLEEFENDLHQHIHLENNILFPKSIELEKGCNS